MKKTHIVLLVFVAVAIVAIVSVFADFSTYETFTSAAKEPGKQFHVIGYYEKDKETEYNPVKDPNRFSFYVKDKVGDVKKVVFNGSRPTDIEKSEQVVMTGYMSGDEFHCNKIQMKCPSKYKKDEVVVGNG